MWAASQLEYEGLELTTPKEGGGRSSLCKGSEMGGLCELGQQQRAKRWSFAMRLSKVYEKVLIVREMQIKPRGAITLRLLGWQLQKKKKELSAGK